MTKPAVTDIRQAQARAIIERAIADFVRMGATEETAAAILGTQAALRLSEDGLRSLRRCVDELLDEQRDGGW
jgi:hypothetical protein